MQPVSFPTVKQPPVPIGFHLDGRPIWPIAGGDGTEGDEDNPEGNQPPAAPAAPATQATRLSPADVRATPEYQAQVSAARREARLKGEAEARETQLRSELEETRAAAEAQAREAQAAQIASVLGADGVARWNEIAELQATDPVGAAQKFAAFGVEMGQTHAARTAAAAQGGAPAKPPAAPLPSGGVGAGAPIGQATTGTTWDEIADAAEGKFDEIAARQQGPLTERNRVTGRDRAEGMMSHLVGGYARLAAQRVKDGLPVRR